jgi:hypothetical protein
VVQQDGGLPNITFAGGRRAGWPVGEFFGMVQVRQIPSCIICGSIRCGSLKSEGFGDGCTALGVLPSPSCA